jgi:hypothetical protein
MAIAARARLYSGGGGSREGEVRGAAAARKLLCPCAAASTTDANMQPPGSLSVASGGSLLLDVAPIRSARRRAPALSDNAVANQTRPGCDRLLKNEQSEGDEK